MGGICIYLRNVISLFGYLLVRILGFCNLAWDDDASTTLVREGDTVCGNRMSAG